MSHAGTGRGNPRTRRPREFNEIGSRAFPLTRRPIFAGVMVAVLLACAHALAAQADAGRKVVSYRTYIAALQRNGNEAALVAICGMADGHRGVLMFPLGQRVGAYFELEGDRSISSGQVTIANGAFLRRVDGPPAASERALRVMKMLVMSPYHVLTVFQFDTITGVPETQECFEAEP